MRGILIAFTASCITYFVGEIIHQQHELTYSEKRTIAIEFACHEKWKGMKVFCGNLPPADRKDEK